VKILFTADLHLLRATRAGILRELRDWISFSKPDSVVIAGDIANASQAFDALGEVRRSMPGKPIAICLGNHDFWLHEDARNQCRRLSDVIDQYWVPAAQEFDILLLDRENFRIEEVTIVGGYGHYDFGFAIPRLAYRGVVVTEEDYLRGYPYANSSLRWRDFQLMPGGLHPRTVASEEVQGITARLRAAGDSPLIAVLHTPPFEELLGIPAARELTDGSPPSEYAFFRAYLGNRAMGAVLRNVKDKLLAVVCGHTHRQAGPVKLDGVVGINIGSDYGHPKAALYTSETMTMERVPNLRR
jgi:Icc-related predicted phosphoesterase